MALECESVRARARNKDILVLELSCLDDVHPVVLCVCRRGARSLLYPEASGY